MRSTGGFMSKYLEVLLAFANLLLAVQYSLRMKALGTDFAYLIPDYETDIYNDPNLISGGFAGISYEPSLSAPWTTRIQTRRFGWFGNYWGGYRNNKESSSWTPNFTSIRANDVWVLDLRGKFWKFLTGDVLDLRNDFVYEDTNYRAGVGYYGPYYDTTRTIKYLLGASEAFRICQRFKLILRVGAGYYGYYSTDEGTDQRQVIYTGRVGLYYQNVPAQNKFNSFYMTIGGPVSNQEISDLPYSVFLHLPNDNLQQTFIARTVIAQLGCAKGMPLDENSFVVVGMRDVLLYQRTNRVTYSSTEFRGLRNTLSFPIALEHYINHLALRIGVRLYESYKGDKEWTIDSVLTRFSEQTLGLEYSWGIGWRLTEDFTIDLYNTNSLAAKSNWAIYLRRVW